MAIRILKDGRIRVYWKDKATRKTTSKNFPRGELGMAEAVEFNRQLNLGERRKRVMRRTFSEVAMEYMIAKQAENTSSTLENLYYKLRGIILPEIGAIPINRITPAKIDQYINKRLKDPVCTITGTGSRKKRKIIIGKDGLPKKVKKTTVHREVTDIISILNWAVERQYTAVNLLYKYKKPKRDDERIRPANIQETGSILDNAPEHLYRAIAISYYTGIRPGKVELLRLTWDTIDWEAQTITAISAKKGGLDHREIPIHPDFMDMLKQWKKMDPEDQQFIITYNGKPISSIKKSFQIAKNKAKIERRLTPYSFRHAFATAILKAGGDLKSTSEILGHTRTETTTRIYQHTDSKLHQDTIKRLPAIRKKDIAKNDGEKCKVIQLFKEK